jgi:hypothetical protein
LLLLEVFEVDVLEILHASRTLAFESRLLLLEIFEVDVLEILQQLAFYVTIDRLKTIIQQE